MTSINAYKMDGLGNDFVIIDRRKNSINLTKEKIIELGSRSNIGFDQIIFIEKEKENFFPITIFTIICPGDVDLIISCPIAFGLIF